MAALRNLPYQPPLADGEREDAVACDAPDSPAEADLASDKDTFKQVVVPTSGAAMDGLMSDDELAALGGTPQSLDVEDGALGGRLGAAIDKILRRGIADKQATIVIARDEHRAATVAVLEFDPHSGMPKVTLPQNAVSRVTDREVFVTCGTLVVLTMGRCVRGSPLVPLPRLPARLARYAGDQVIRARPARRARPDPPPDLGVGDGGPAPRGDEPDDEGPSGGGGAASPPDRVPLLDQLTEDLVRRCLRDAAPEVGPAPAWSPAAIQAILVHPVWGRLATSSPGGALADFAALGGIFVDGVPILDRVRPPRVTARFRDQLRTVVASRLPALATRRPVTEDGIRRLIDDCVRELPPEARYPPQGGGPRGQPRGEPGRQLMRRAVASPEPGSPASGGQDQPPLQGGLVGVEAPAGNVLSGPSDFFNDNRVLDTHVANEVLSSMGVTADVALWSVTGRVTPRSLKNALEFIRKRTSHSGFNSTTKIVKIFSMSYNRIAAYEHWVWAGPVRRGPREPRVMIGAVRPPSVPAAAEDSGSWD